MANPILDFMPVSGQLTLVEASLEDCQALLTSTMAKHKTGRRLSLTIHQCTQGLRSAFGFLDPVYHLEGSRKLLIKTRHPKWVAVFNNSEYAAPAPKYFSAQLKTQAIGCRLQPDTLTQKNGKAHGRYGVLDFDYCVNGKQERVVGILHETSGWIFLNQGKPFSFEDKIRYRAKRISERFDAALLIHYLKAFNLHPFEDAFYRVDKKSPAVILEMKWPGMNDPRPQPLEKLRRQSLLTPAFLGSIQRAINLQAAE